MTAGPGKNRIVLVRILNNKNLWLTVFVAVAGALCAWLATCSGAGEPRFVSAKEVEGVVTLTELTPLEIKVFEKVVNGEVSPCGDDVTLAESLFNPEHCPLSLRAANFVTEMVTEDYNAEEISKAYMARYAHVKGLEIPVNDSPRKGPDKASILLVVFTDFECPFCARAAEEIHELMRRYPDDMALVHKNFPIKSHENAEASARAALAAHKQGKFWQMHDVLFSAHGSPLSKERLDTMAVGLGLDMEKFESDFSSEEVTAAIEADKQLGSDLGVDGTPSIFINGRFVEKGIRGLKERIAEEFLRGRK